MARITRRRLLKLSASGAVTAQIGGLAAVLATGRAPAFATGQEWPVGSGQASQTPWHEPSQAQAIPSKLNPTEQQDFIGGYEKLLNNLGDDKAVVFANASDAPGTSSGLLGTKRPESGS
jgi:hypothetical protein